MGISYWDFLGSWDERNVTVKNKWKGKKIVLMKSYEGPFALTGSSAEHPLPSSTLRWGSGKKPGLGVLCEGSSGLVGVTDSKLTS